MSSTTKNNKQIAKNTLLLYVRMLLLMIVNLYTSRLVLNALGIGDYGIYNVVGGMVAMFSILSGSLSSAISRFITYELGKGCQKSLNKIFSSAVTIQIGLALIIAILAETVGFWFLNTKMIIPVHRLEAANWVFQFSILTFIINLISVPYNACIIAHEKMSAFAYISLLEASCKLIIALLIVTAPIDKLKFYAILMCAIAILIRFTYGNYCKKHFKECHYHFIWDKDLLKRMWAFAGWNFIGASSAVLRDQGGNIVINLFCGPSINAARGIASQVSNTIQSFVSNFMTALNPQITKSYASEDYPYMMTLIFQGARFSFYLLLLLSLPVLINTHYILQLWLKIVPEHTVLFIQLILLFAISESLSQPLITAMLATGKIRNYQIIVGGLQMLNLPLSYILLRLGSIPEIIIIISIIISQLCLAARLILLKKMINLSVKKFLRQVYLNVLSVAIISSIIPLIFSNLIYESFFGFILLSTISTVCVCISIYYVGCTNKERSLISKKIHKFILKNHKKASSL